MHLHLYLCILHVHHHAHVHTHVHVVYLHLTDGCTPAKCAGTAPLTLHPSRPSLCSSWETKCNWQLNCAGCPECDAVTPPPPNCKPWCANNGKCVQPFSVSHTLSYAPTHLACVPPTHRPNAQAFLTPTRLPAPVQFVGDEVQMAAQLCGLPRVQLAPASAPLTSMSTTMSTMSTRMSTASGSETKDRRRYGFTAAPPVGSANARACALILPSLHCV